MNHRFYIVFDFETDGKDPVKDSPVELAAVPIEPRKLEILKNDVFNVTIKPIDIAENDYFERHQDTIHWHAQNRQCQPREMVNKWETGLEQSVAWDEFNHYCKQYHCKKRPGQWYVDPIPAGYNIINFDLVIAKRLSAAHNLSFPFSPVNKVDAMDWLFTWFENLKEPTNLKMDTLREFFGIESNGFAHEGLVDVLDEAKIIVEFLKFQRRQSSINKFKGAFKNVHRDHAEYRDEPTSASA